MLFLCYPTCPTCQKAKAFLDERGVSYEARDIKLENPTTGRILSRSPSAAAARRR